MRISFPLGIGLVFLVIIILIAVFFPIKTQKNKENAPLRQFVSPSISENKDYTLDYSEGTCSTKGDCVWAGQGCGGGHGMCTNTPEAYEGAISTCEINEKFPSNNGYSCTCITDLKKCGWTK